MEQETKRIMIFTPSLSERQQIRWFMEGYLKKNFAGYISDIDLQDFENFYAPKGNVAIGHLDERELLYIIDLKSSSKKPVTTEQIKDAKRYYDEWLMTSCIESFRLINEKEIPYILYQGEFAEIRDGRKVTSQEREILRKRLTDKLEAKESGKNSIRDRILKRLKQAA